MAGRLTQWRAVLLAGGFWVATLSAHAQLRIIGNLHPPPDETVSISLLTYYGEDLVPVKTVEAGAEGAFEMRIDRLPHPGLYRLKANAAEGGTDLVLSGADTAIHLSGSYDALRQGKGKIEQAIEHAIYRQLMHHYRVYKYRLDSLDYLAGQISKLDSFYYKRKEALRQAQRLNNQRFNSQLRTLAGQHPGTYVGDVLCQVFNHPSRMAEIYYAFFYDNDRRFHHDHYFDQVDFSDPRILYHPVFKFDLMNYFNLYGGELLAEQQSAIDRLLARAEANEEVYPFVINTFLEFFVSIGADVMLQYLLEKHVGGCHAGISKANLQKLQRFDAVKIGRPAPALRLPDASGQPVALSNVAAQHPVTLVYFWASWCAHCQRENPKVVELFEKYNPQGLAVYAISLDTKKAEWLQAVRAFSMRWINVSDLQGWESDAARQMNILHTPATVLLDRQGRIIGKNLRGQGLENKIATLLE